MNSREAVEALDALIIGDREASHSEADKILIAYMKTLGYGAKSVAEAWERADERCGFVCA